MQVKEPVSFPMREQNSWKVTASSNNAAFSYPSGDIPDHNLKSSDPCNVNSRSQANASVILGNGKTSRLSGKLSIFSQWKRSVFQLLWKPVLIYILTYVSLSALYQFILDEDGKRSFRVASEHCSGYSRSINLFIMLGFFTSTAMHRLFTMQTTIPGTAKAITVFIFSLKLNLPEGPMLIDTFARWQVLTWILTFRIVSRPVAKIYPDLASLQTAGLLTSEERLVMENNQFVNTSYPLIVIDWMLLLLKDTFVQGRFFDSFNYLKNVDILVAFKKSCGSAIKFSTHNIPPALIQAVTLAVYGFGIVTLMNRTFPKEDSSFLAGVIPYIPLMPGLQFFIYFAWLHFGKSAVDPFGDDEDDIDVKQLVQCHIADSIRLRQLYDRQLDDIFPVWMQNQSRNAVDL